MNHLPEEEYQKAIGQFKLQLNGVFEPFQCYGLEIYIEGAKEECVRLAEDFGLRVRGNKDKPIDLQSIRRKKRRKK